MSTQLRVATVKNKLFGAAGTILLLATGWPALGEADQGAETVASWPSVQSLAGRLPCRLKIFTVSSRQALTPAHTIAGRVASLGMVYPDAAFTARRRS